MMVEICDLKTLVNSVCFPVQTVFSGKLPTLIDLKWQEKQNMDNIFIPQWGVFSDMKIKKKKNCFQLLDLLKINVHSFIITF